MYTDVTISAEDFKIIHNTLWALEYQGLDGTKAAGLIRDALRSAYDQDSTAFDSKMDYYRQFQKDNALRAIWSVYELPVHGFLWDHPYRGALTLSYQGHAVPILGQTWADLYRAADDVIRRSGDGHHIFIEGFMFAGDELRLTTGS